MDSANARAGKKGSNLGFRRVLDRVVDGFSFPLSANKFFNTARAPLGTSARVVGITTETLSCKTLVLKPRGKFAHKAGQFVTVTLNIDGAWQQRCYSISSADSASETIAITVQDQPGGRASKYLHSRSAGDVIYVSAAMGEFVEPSDTEQPLLLITGGSGITPIMSMLRSNLLAGERAVTHIHYAPDREHTIFADELVALTANSQYELITEYTQQGGARYSAAQLATHCPDWQQRQTLLCGPAALMQAVTRDWAAAGIATQLTQEAFGPAHSSEYSDRDRGSVHFTVSDKKLTADEATTDANNLLETAEAAGLSPKHGCRNGICHSCDCHLLNGTVRNLRTGELIHTSADRGPVFIQPCISTAVGDVEVEL